MVSLVLADEDAGAAAAAAERHIFERSREGKDEGDAWSNSKLSAGGGGATRSWWPILALHVWGDIAGNGEKARTCFCGDAVRVISTAATATAAGATTGSDLMLSTAKDEE